MDLKLQQKELAQIIGVDEVSIYNWENNRSSPAIRYMPKIGEFLGSIPNSGQPESLGEKIVNARHLRGISQENLAHYLGIDPGTLANWEKNKRQPLKRFMEKLEISFTSPNSIPVNL